MKIMLKCIMISLFLLVSISSTYAALKATSAEKKQIEAVLHSESPVDNFLSLCQARKFKSVSNCLNYFKRIAKNKAEKQKLTASPKWSCTCSSHSGGRYQNKVEIGTIFGKKIYMCWLYC